MKTRFYGKLLGFIAGWLLLRHPAGGLLGLIIGHAFDADWLRRKRPDPYAELGLTDEASDGETPFPCAADALYRAYRRLIAQYHPDRLAGVAPELVRQAEEKAKRLNAAYAEITRLRSRND